MKDKRTNKNYNPTVEFNKAINSDWFKEIVTRMGKEENIKKALQMKDLFNVYSDNLIKEKNNEV